MTSDGRNDASTFASSSSGVADRRREQRLERASLLFPDDAVGGERDPAEQRSDQEEHEELLEQERFRRRL